MGPLHKTCVWSQDEFYATGANIIDRYETRECETNLED